MKIWHCLENSHVPAHPLELVLLEHRVERLIGKDEMVQYLYAKQVSCGP